MRILITRPKEDADSFAASLSARGIDVAVEPLLTIQPVPNPVIDLTDELSSIGGSILRNFVAPAFATSEG